MYSFFNLGAKWSGWSTPCTGRFTPGKDRVPIVHRLGEPQDRSGRVRKISPPTGGIRSVDSPVGSESLYRLLYPGPQRFHIKIYVNILFDDWGNAAHKVSRLTAQNSFIYICLKFEKIIERSIPRHVCGVICYSIFHILWLYVYERKTNCRCFIIWNPAQLLRDCGDERYVASQAECFSIPAFIHAFKKQRLNASRGVSETSPANYYRHTHRQ